jgi:hypothetical protein
MANRPDIMIKNRKNMDTDTCRNTSRQKCHTKESRKEIKHNSLYMQIKRIWNMKCLIIPVIIWATRIVTKGSEKNLEAILVTHSTYLLQKTPILGTSHTKYGKYCSLKHEA